MQRSTKQCEGPLIWFDATNGAVLECAYCGYVVVTGNVNDDVHANTSVMREGVS